MGHSKLATDFSWTKPVGKAAEDCAFTGQQLRGEQGNDITSAYPGKDRIAVVGLLKEDIPVLRIGTDFELSASAFG
jgi:hypothetical protein